MKHPRIDSMIRWLPDASLRVKMMGAVIATTLVGIMVASAILFVHQALNQRQLFQSEVESLAQIIADYAIAPITFSDHPGTQAALDVMNGREDIVAAELRNSDGAVLARIGATDSEAFRSPSGDAIHKAELWVRVPLNHRGESLGELVMLATFSPAFRRTVDRFLPALGFTLFGALVVLTPFTWWAGGLLLGRLHELTWNVTQIASTGDYDVRARITGDDEVGVLTRNFNAMLDELQRKDQVLRQTNGNLAEEIQERRRLETAVVESSRIAGMAEVATGVLHNVGNVLNSINVSAQLVREKIDQSRVRSLGRTADLLAPHVEDPEPFLTTDPKAKLLPRFIVELHQQILEEQNSVKREIFTLTENLEHIKEVVAAQQRFAGTAGVMENLDPTELFEDALKINRSSLERHVVTINRELTPNLRLVNDRHNILQILVNLISNAIQAVKPIPSESRVVTLSTELDDQSTIAFRVTDHGIGISQENLTRIFQHGFTTRHDGHGFGLHSGANTAKQLGGKLRAESAGPGQGASFTLELPQQPPVHDDNVPATSAKP